MKDFLFTYGTLQKGSVQRKVFGRELKGSADILQGYTLMSATIEDEAFLSKGEEKVQHSAVRSTDNSDVIEGTVLEVTQEDLRLADAYEPEGYKRRRVELRSGRSAWIFTRV